MWNRKGDVMLSNKDKFHLLSNPVEDPGRLRSQCLSFSNHREASTSKAFSGQTRNVREELDEDALFMEIVLKDVKEQGYGHLLNPWAKTVTLLLDRISPQHVWVPGEVTVISTEGTTVSAIHYLEAHTLFISRLMEMAGMQQGPETKHHEIMNLYQHQEEYYKQYGKHGLTCGCPCPNPVTPHMPRCVFHKRSEGDKFVQRVICRCPRPEVVHSEDCPGPCQNLAFQKGDKVYSPLSGNTFEATGLVNICSHTGRLHICGADCKRMVYEKELHLYVCPISGLTGDYLHSRYPKWLTTSKGRSLDSDAGERGEDDNEDEEVDESGNYHSKEDDANEGDDKEDHVDYEEEGSQDEEEDNDDTGWMMQEEDPEFTYYHLPLEELKHDTGRLSTATKADPADEKRMVRSRKTQKTRFTHTQSTPIGLAVVKNMGVETSYMGQMIGTPSLAPSVESIITSPSTPSTPHVAMLPPSPSIPKPSQRNRKQGGKNGNTHNEKTIIRECLSDILLEGTYYIQEVFNQARERLKKLAQRVSKHNAQTPLENHLFIKGQEPGLELLLKIAYIWDRKHVGRFYQEYNNRLATHLIAHLRLFDSLNSTMTQKDRALCLKAVCYGIYYNICPEMRLLMPISALGLQKIKFTPKLKEIMSMHGYKYRHGAGYYHPEISF